MSQSGSAVSSVSCTKIIVENSVLIWKLAFWFAKKMDWSISSDTSSNLFKLKFNNKDTRMTSLTLFWFHFCWLWTYLTLFSKVSIVHCQHEKYPWRSCSFTNSVVLICRFFSNHLICRIPVNNCFLLTESLFSYPKISEADLGLLQHPRWSSLW